LENSNYKKIEIKVPTIFELINSLDKKFLTNEVNNEITKYYAYELSSMINYSKNINKPQITLQTFIKNGSQWVSDFSVKDLEKEVKDQFNFHFQNTSQWVYAGCILFDEKDNSISTHH